MYFELGWSGVGVGGAGMSRGISNQNLIPMLHVFESMFPVDWNTSVPLNLLFFYCCFLISMMVNYF